MRLYIFKSDANTGLRAFTGDAAGSELSDRFSPWRAIGVVAPENAPSYNLSRETIEEAIGTHGFQLWRVKAKVAKLR